MSLAEKWNEYFLRNRLDWVSESEQKVQERAFYAGAEATLMGHMEDTPEWWNIRAEIDLFRRQK